MMKLKIKGDITLPVLGKAMDKALAQLDFDPKTQVVKGATIYFNVYDAESDEVIEYEVDAMVYETPVEQAKRELKAKLKQQKRRLPPKIPTLSL